MRSAEMDEFVERVEQSSDIVAVVSQYVALKRKGGRFWGLLSVSSGTYAVVLGRSR